MTDRVKSMPTSNKCRVAQCNVMRLLGLKTSYLEAQAKESKTLCWILWPALRSCGIRSVCGLLSMGG